jgi:hypothetical protein
VLAASVVGAAAASLTGDGGGGVVGGGGGDGGGQNSHLAFSSPRRHFTRKKRVKHWRDTIYLPMWLEK